MEASQEARKQKTSRADRKADNETQARRGLEGFRA